MTIKFEDILNKDLREPEFQKEWLRQTALEYIQSGDFEHFFTDLEQVIKATTTVSKYAEKIGLDRVQLTKILHGKTKKPNIDTINKILDGLELGYELKYEITLQPKSA